MLVKAHTISRGDKALPLAGFASLMESLAPPLLPVTLCLVWVEGDFYILIGVLSFLLLSLVSHSPNPAEMCLFHLQQQLFQGRSQVPRVQRWSPQLLCKVLLNSL